MYATTKFKISALLFTGHNFHEFSQILRISHEDVIVKFPQLQCLVGSFQKQSCQLCENKIMNFRILLNQEIKCRE